METAILLLATKRMWTMNHQKPSSVIAMLNCCYAMFWRECWFTNRQETLFIVWTHIWSSMLQYHDKWLGSHFGEKLYKFQTDLSVLDRNDHINSRRVTSTKHQIDPRNPRHQNLIRRLEDKKYCFGGTVWQEYTAIYLRRGAWFDISCMCMRKHH